MKKDDHLTNNMTSFLKLPQGYATLLNIATCVHATKEVVASLLNGVEKGICYHRQYPCLSHCTIINIYVSWNGMISI